MKAPEHSPNDIDQQALPNDEEIRDIVDTALSSMTDLIKGGFNDSTRLVSDLVFDTEDWNKLASLIESGCNKFGIEFPDSRSPNILLREFAMGHAHECNRCDEGSICDLYSSLKRITKEYGYMR